MVSTRKLSSDEVNALIEGLNDGADTVLDQATSPDVKPFIFGSDELSLLGDYYALRLINERFARQARAIYLPMLRILPRISPFPPEVKTFDEYTANMDNFMSLTISRIEELRGSVLLVLDPSFISILTNAYYGGNIAYLPNGRSEFTTAETRVITIVTDGLHRALEAAWRDLMPLAFSNPVHEDNLQFATFVESEEKVVCCSFIVQLPDADPATMDLIYPLQALKPIAARLRSRMQSDQVDDDLRWRARLQEAVMAVPLNVTARLAQPTVPLNHIVGLTPGRVVPVDLAPRPQLLVEGTALFDGEPGAQGGRAALSLTRKLND